MEAEKEKSERSTEKRKRTPLTSGAADDDKGELGSITVRLSDESVLDCPVCSVALEIPVFQCCNGHVICSSCRDEVKQKCPSCTKKVGNARNWAIEDVLKAVKVHCPYKGYGCPIELSYSSKRFHEENCAYAPFKCPFDKCGFAGCQKRLSLHLSNSHAMSVFRLHFDQVCSFPMFRLEKFVVLREEANGTIFALINKYSRIRVSCIGGSAEDRFAYALVVRGKDSCLRFQSFTVQFENTVAPSEDFIEVPSCLFSSDGFLKLELCVWRKGAPSVDIAKGSLGEAQ